MVDSSETSTITGAKGAHGPFGGVFRPTTLSRTFAMPRHNRFVLKFRFWAADQWDNETGFVNIDGHRQWNSTVRHFTQTCSADGWKSSSTYDKFSTLAKGGLCYLDVAVDLEHTSSIDEHFTLLNYGFDVLAHGVHIYVY